MTAAQKAQKNYSVKRREIRRKVKSLDPLALVDEARKFIAKAPPKHRRDLLKMTVQQLAEVQIASFERYGY